MAIFGDNEELASLKIRYENLKTRTVEVNAERKKIAAELVVERQRSMQLGAEIDLMKVEIEKAHTAVRKARQRQKQSVARANRFKSKMG